MLRSKLFNSRQISKQITNFFIDNLWPNAIFLMKARATFVQLPRAGALHLSQAVIIRRNFQLRFCLAKAESQWRMQLVRIINDAGLVPALSICDVLCYKQK